jgi:RNA polymerase sigma-54 factor
MEFGFDQSLDQRQRNLPRLIEANYLLHLTAQELHTVIAQELAENPALELEEEADNRCPACGRTLERGICPSCPLPALPDGPTATSPLADDFDWSEPVARDVSPDDDFDPMTLIAARSDARAQLRADAQAALPTELHAIAAVLIESLDDHGFLNADLPSLAAMAGCSLELAETALREIQAIAPPGVAARDLRECLLLQVAWLRSLGEEPPALVLPIIEDHLADLGAHRYHALARLFHTSTEEVGEAHGWIRDSLTPHPWQEERLAATGVLAAPYVRPDVVIRVLEDGEIRAEIAGGADRGLHLNDLYRELSSRSRAHGAGAPTEGEREHIRASVLRARQFMSKLEQRRDTLQRISQAVCELQEGYIRGGVRELRPLTRADVANTLGIHESTVSRAVANKFVLLPNRTVAPFSDFFVASLSIKDVIREMIEQETAAGKALSDQVICDRLQEQGYRIARRTVAKYRAELRILPSTIRS